MVARTLHELLYDCPGRVARGECRAAAFDLEDRLRAADFGGHFVIRAQDEQEEATHFEWLGRIGDETVHLEVQRGYADSYVTVLSIGPACGLERLLSDFRGKPALLRI